MSDMRFMRLWCSGYHYCITSFNKAWTQILRRFKPCSQRVGDSRWWGPLTVVSAGNKAECLSSVNHTTKTNHHQISLFRSFFNEYGENVIEKHDRCKIDTQLRNYLVPIIESYTWYFKIVFLKCPFHSNLDLPFNFSPYAPDDYFL